MEILGTVDATLHDMLTLTSGQLAEKTWSIAEIDSTASPVTRTWTVKARMNEFGDTIRENDFSRFRIAGVLTAVPTEA